MNFNIPKFFSDSVNMEIKGEMPKEAIDKVIESQNRSRKIWTYSFAFLICCIGVSLLILTIGYVFKAS